MKEFQLEIKLRKILYSETLLIKQPPEQGQVKSSLVP